MGHARFVSLVPSGRPAIDLGRSSGSSSELPVLARAPEQVAQLVRAGADPPATDRQGRPVEQWWLEQCVPNRTEWVKALEKQRRRMAGGAGIMAPMNRPLLAPAGLPTLSPWPHWPGLRSVTFTGLDEATDWEAFRRLSEARPEAEWGVLYSKQHAGAEGRWRYPSLPWIQSLAERWAPGTRRALHLCGQVAHDWIAGDPSLRALGANFQRIQLNVAGARTDATALHRALASGAHPAVITQHHDGNRSLTEALGVLANHALLFDGSGGRGHLPSTWPEPLPHRAVGYAGGLGPLTIVAQSQRIQALVNGQPHWLDMEQALRDSADRFDLSRVTQVLAALDRVDSTPEI